MNNEKRTMKILEAIHDAVQLGNKFHKAINTLNLPKEEQENVRYLGQVIRSMDFILSDERNRQSPE
jgi:hypothetical protein